MDTRNVGVYWEGEDGTQADTQPYEWKEQHGQKTG